MSSRTYACLYVAGLLFCVQNVKTQESLDSEVESSSIQIPRSAIEKLVNVTDERNLWILLPSNFTEGKLNEADFSLFKLNTDNLAKHLGSDVLSPADSWVGAESSSSLTRRARIAETASLFRDSRKMNLFGNVLNKPKVSPLYLVNGTVCRFVNTQPICTTLSTTGLFRGQTQVQNNALGGFFNQQPQNNNQLQPNQRQLLPNQQGGFNGQGFNNNPQTNNQFQQFRPAALVDDESRDVNVESASNSTRVRQKPTRQQSLNVVQIARPLNYMANRRPLNLLSFGRPFRTQYLRRGKDASGLRDELSAIE